MSLEDRLRAMQRAMQQAFKPPGGSSSAKKVIPLSRLLALERAFVCPLEPPPPHNSSRASEPSRESDSQFFEAVRLFAKDYHRLPCADSKDSKEASLGKALKHYT